MSWRTVVITQRAKLDLKMGCMTIRTESDTKRVNIDELSVLMIEEHAVSITGCLLTELAKRKVRVVLCDEKRNPCCEVVPHYGSHDSSAKVRTQIAWSEDMKQYVWTQIVAEKIRQQARHLRDVGAQNEADMLRGYISEMEYIIGEFHSDLIDSDERLVII